MDRTLAGGGHFVNGNSFISRDRRAKTVQGASSPRRVLDRSLTACRRAGINGRPVLVSARRRVH